MLLLILAFRSLLSSGASLLSGAFFFGARKVSWFSGLAALVLSATLPASANAASQHSITFDHYSLMIDGKRVFIYSGEFHPFRLPSPSLWLDVFQKMKAGGFNTICGV